MKKDILLFIALLVFHSPAWAEKASVDCNEIPAKETNEKKVRGKIFYTVIDKTCIEDSSKTTTCVKSVMTDFDRCKDKKTLVKQVCGEKGPSQKEVPCDCDAGICKK